MTISEAQYAWFGYQYRDADNYKASNELLLRGSAGAAIERAIHGGCDSEMYFVAEQIGIPTLYEELYQYSNGPTCADVAFHEFQYLHPATPDEPCGARPWGTVNGLLRRFATVQTWNCRLSAHGGWHGRTSGAHPTHVD